jgi:general secretion pathway protein G
VQDSRATPRPRFSLGKILIVAAVVGVAGMLGLVVVATVFVPTVLAKVSEAQRVKVQMDLASIRRALDQYKVANGGTWPDSLEVLAIPDENGQTFLGATEVPKDPWGHAYLYEAPQSPGDEPRILSLGADGKPGGEGKNADIGGGSRPASQ